VYLLAIPIFEKAKLGLTIVIVDGSSQR